MLINQILDRIGMSQTANFDFHASIRRAAHADLAGIKQSLKERLLQLYIANMAMPDFRDRPAEPTAVQAGPQIRDGQFCAAAGRYQTSMIGIPIPTSESRMPKTKPIGLLRNIDGEATYTVFSFDMVDSLKRGTAFNDPGPHRTRFGREFRPADDRGDPTVKILSSLLKMTLLPTVPGDETAAFQ